MKNKETLTVSLLAVLGGICFGMLLLLISGQSVGALFSSFLEGISGVDLSSDVIAIDLRYFGEFLVECMPIILTGLSVAFAYRSGLFNIGAEGQLIIGSMASVAVAILFPMTGFLHVIMCVLAGAIAGALWGAIPGILKSKFHVHEVVVCIMMNYTGLQVANYFIKQLPGSTQTKTVIIPQTASLSSSFLKGLTNNSRLHWGILLVIIAVFIYWFIMHKTAFGYSLRATGFNKDGAKYAGMKVNRNIIYSMMIAGAFAGLAGAIISLGTFNLGRVLTTFENYGFDGIAVALVGACNALGIVLSGLLFGLLKIAQNSMQSFGIPKETGQIISAFIVLFVAMQYGIVYIKEKYKKKICKNERRGEEA